MGCRCLCVVSAILLFGFGFGNAEGDLECDASYDGYMCHFSETCGKTYKRSGYVINGTSVEKGEFPSFAQILTPGFFCSGVIVSDYHIVTAEDCLRNGNLAEDNRPEYFHPNDLHVYVGYSSNLATRKINGGPNYNFPPGAMKVSTYCIHPLASDDWREYNTVIITLQDKLEFNEYVQPACWPYDEGIANFHGEYDEPCYLVGIGASHEGESFVHQSQVQKMRIREIPCPPANKIGEDAICARNYDGSINQRTCFADLGGPAYCFIRERKQWFVLGVKIFLRDICSNHFYLGPLRPLLAWLTKKDKCDPTDWKHKLRLSPLFENIE